MDYIPPTFEIRENFPFYPTIGLQNIGATCYMNATLQCFCHIEKFINYFKYNQQIIDSVRNDKTNLTASFKLLIEKLWPNNYDPETTYKYYEPKEFKEKISKMNPLFEGISSNDAKDLVNFIIMILHIELNRPNNNGNNINNNINVNQNFLNQTNRDLMFNIFWNEFSSSNNSIINQLFYAINNNVTQCLRCQNKIYNFQTYFFLVFPLEEVRKYKISNQFNMYNNFNNINNFNNNEVTIFDCFEYDTKITMLAGENAIYCHFCKTRSNCNMCTFLTTLPEILILLLNRGQGKEFDVKINFTEFLDLRNYIENINTGYTFQLIGVVSQHIGEGGIGKNFIAYCRHPISKKWHKYNDGLANPFYINHISLRQFHILKQILKNFFKILLRQDRND